MPLETGFVLSGVVTLGVAAAPETAPPAAAGFPHEFWTAGFYLLLFAGCTLLAAVLGLVSSWIDRKVTALVQARIGPPLLQPFYDFVKLLGKETLIPAGANRMAFLLMPLVALAGVSLAATVLLGNVFWQNGLIGSYGFVGDLVVVLYLLVVPSVALVIGASSSNNPFASVGASRELKMMSYELPMLLSVAAALTLASGAEVRFTREAQSQVDARLGANSLLVSREGKEEKFKAKQAELQWKEKYRNSIIAAHFPQAAKRLLSMRRDMAALRSPGAIEAARAELKTEENWLIAAVPASVATLKARKNLLDDELKILKKARDSAAIKETIRKKREKEALKKVIADLEKLPGLIKSVRGLPREVEEARAALAGGPQAPPLTAKVPLRLQRILTMRRAGPMPDEELLLVDAVVDKVGDLYRAKDRGREAVEEALNSGEIEAGEREKLRAEVARRKRELKSIDADAKRLGGVEGSASGLDGAALVEAARGRFLDRWVSGFVLALCMLVVLACAQAKLGLVPFDCAEADTEIAGGVLIEYGGPPLAIWKLVKAMLLFTMPVFIGVVFLGGFRFYVPDGQATWADLGQAATSVAKYVLILVFFILVRNTNPRVRVDQAMRFFLGPMTFLAFIALILAVVVHWMSVG